MKNKVTIRHLAKELNSTPATVSRALNNHPRISEETKKAVWALADKLHYRRNHLASSLRSGKSHTIGVIIPSAEINFFGSVVHGIESIANTKGYGLLLYQSSESPENEIKAVESFIGAKVDGILASIAKETMDFSHYLEVKNLGIPLVFFDRTNDSLNASSVVIDDFKGAYIATEHLVKQGYKRIAHISGQQHLKIFAERLNGYRAALHDYGFAPDDTLIYNGNVSISAGRDAIGYFLQLDNKPDAVFAVEDFTALGAIKRLKEENVKIPGEFGVIGFANELFGEHITPTLSTIDQQTIQMGRRSFELLMQLVNKESKDGFEAPRNIILEPILMCRNSSLKRNEI